MRKQKHLIIIGHPDKKSFCYNGIYKTVLREVRKHKQEYKVIDLYEDKLHRDRKGLIKELTGDKITEADLRLIPTLLRFDIVYVTHFKCNIRQIKDYKNLSRYTKELYEIPAIKETTNLDHIKRHYYYSHEEINPYRIIPRGPNKIF